jgi:hypothetical protein
LGGKEVGRLLVIILQSFKREKHGKKVKKPPSQSFGYRTNYGKKTVGHAPTTGEQTQ